MNNKIRLGLLGIVFIAAVGADCCDPRHDALAENQRNIQVCRDRGGVPILNTETDDGGHTFTVLQRCDFPPQFPPAEKR